ncbi:MULTISPECIES: uroporphyrinogen-III synthase [Flavobacteriaceae]|uniref:uroporphyrinogen-III synthase n=1 Tax=Flavobacteriaceae TaxID=49546 RepID=UPI001491C1E6|nr:MULTISPECIES: uroporphyrinogen-III synthase [Allomuricauda]MDC6366368.1 uroporphyrinogen-III synthase [Muricauda sp. AC10]
MKTVLSTKLLSLPQKELLLNSGLGLVEQDALHIELLKVNIPQGFSNYIFTSKNGVKAFLSQTKAWDYVNFQCFCVGEKTKMILEENNLKVVKTTKNATDLADFIFKNHQNETFLFLCGNQRRDELPSSLEKNNIRYKEVQVYNTILNPKKFNRSFDGILFYSPSGIKSFLVENSMGESMVFCIGNTTASEAKKHTNNIITANRPTVENVLVQAIKYFKQHD